jgi:hypothetical protein
MRKTVFIGLLVYASSVFAFDGKREGFVLGIGAGGHYGLMEEVGSDIDPYEQTDKKFGWVTEFLMGYSTSRFTFFGDIARSSYVSGRERRNFGFEMETVPKKLVIYGAGANAYLFDDSNAKMNPFLSLRAGVLVHKEDESLYKGRSFGFVSGIGVEIFRFVSIEARLLKGEPVETSNTLNVTSYQLVLLGVLY